MQKPQEHSHNKTLLVFNCHEAWVYQLGILGYNLYIIVGLKERYKQTWDEQMRPIPPNSRLVTLAEALQSPTNYYEHRYWAKRISDHLQPIYQKSF